MQAFQRPNGHAVVSAKIVYQGTSPSVLHSLSFDSGLSVKVLQALQPPQSDKTIVMQPGSMIGAAWIVQGGDEAFVKP